MRCASYMKSIVKRNGKRKKTAIWGMLESDMGDAGEEILLLLLLLLLLLGFSPASLISLSSCAEEEEEEEEEDFQSDAKSSYSLPAVVN
jgi:hypothetical protein